MTSTTSRTSNEPEPDPEDTAPDLDDDDDAPDPLGENGVDIGPDGEPVRTSLFSSPRFIRATIVVLVAGFVLAVAGFIIEILTRKQ